ncbi:MAG TPA: hypothetical protein DCY51_04150, partial [Bacteroidetes bacterium]|nr:hypothetical protein [Bacteroidota bacterium]
MATTKIIFTYTEYADVDEIQILRSTILKNEKAFEDALNLDPPGTGYDYLSVNSANELSAGTYQVQDTEAVEGQQYWYCVAAKGPGSNGGFRVGTGSSPSTTDVTTETTLGSTSVASVVGGSGQSRGISSGGGGDTGGGD